MNSFGEGRAAAGALGAWAVEPPEGRGVPCDGAMGAGVIDGDGAPAGGAEGGGADADVVAGRFAQPVTINPSSNDITMRCPARITMTPPLASPREIPLAGPNRITAVAATR